MKNLRIGITIGLKDVDQSFWTNGMNLNILYLARLLKNSKNNYKVTILNTTNIDVSNKSKTFEEFDLFNIKDKYEEIDLLICMGSQVEKKYLQHFEQDPNKKVIAYKCGNNYVLSIEDVLFKESKSFFEFETELDEIWYVPQQHETNIGYYQTIYRANAVVVPFLWDHKNLLDSLVEIEKNHLKGTFKRSSKYDPTREKKTIGIMEPNLNIVKYCLIPTMIVEESYRTDIGKEKIESLMITNATEVSKHKTFLSIIRTFDMYKDGKISAETRYQTAFMLSQYLDIVVSHQLLNPLNYLYLDAAFMGYPVLHNAPMCKDIGYYYEGCDTVEASKKLNWILENHDNNLKEYSEKNTKALWRYSVRNIELVNVYDDLIFNLFNGGNHGLKYNETTNLYTKKNIRNKVKKSKKGGK
jgi:hypothetical protein